MMTLGAQKRTLNEVKKNRVTAKDLQKLTFFDRTTVGQTLYKNVLHLRKPQRKSWFEVCKDTWMVHSTTGKRFCTQMKPKRICLRGTDNKTMCGGKLDPNYEIRRREQCGLWMLGYIFVLLMRK